MIDLFKLKNIPLVIESVRKKGKIRRGDLYIEVKRMQKQKFGKSSSYQVISRDIDRLLKKKIIKVVGGGPRSSILSLS